MNSIEKKCGIDEWNELALVEYFYIVNIYMPGTLYWPDHVVLGSISPIRPKPAICIIFFRASSFCVYILRNSTSPAPGPFILLLRHHYTGLILNLWFLFITWLTERKKQMTRYHLPLSFLWTDRFLRLPSRLLSPKSSELPNYQFFKLA